MSEKNNIQNRVPLDELESVLVQFPKAECDVKHRFTPGMYIREIHIPAGTMLTSMKHKTEHPFVLSQGVAYVTLESGKREVLEAPHTGITKPGTRRAIYAESDLVWITFHVTEETNVEKICEAILEPHENHLIESKQSNQWRDSLPNNQSCLS